MYSRTLFALCGGGGVKSILLRPVSQLKLSPHIMENLMISAVYACI